jgi:hypothetical protein
MRNTSSITLAELVVGVLLLGLGFWALGAALTRPVPSPPEFGVADWLVTLNWQKIIPEPGVYNCPASPDSNEPGVDLGVVGVPSGPNALSRDTVSYAGMGQEGVVAGFLRRLLWERSAGRSSADLCELRN